MALGWTLLCEIPIVLLLSQARPQLRVLLVATSATLITHPFAWKVAILFSPEQYPTGILMIEAVVAGAEAVWFYIWLRPRIIVASTWSLLANSISFLIGMIVLQ